MFIHRYDVLNFNVYTMSSCDIQYFDVTIFFYTHVNFNEFHWNEIGLSEAKCVLILIYAAFLIVKIVQVIYLHENMWKICEDCTYDILYL